MTNGASQLVGGIIPYAFGSDADPFTTGVESPTTRLVTYGANGITPVNTYLENTVAGSTSTTNVRLGTTATGTSYALGGAVSANALVLAPGFDGNSNGVNGVTVTGGSLNLTTGVLLSATSGFTPGNAINSGIGNIVNTDVTVSSSTAETIFACPGALTFNGKLTGATSLTKTGSRTLFMNNTASDYTGTTRLSSFNRFKGNLPVNAPSAYGSSSFAIEMFPSNRVQDDPSFGFSGAEQAIFAPDAQTGAGLTITVDRPFIIHSAGSNGAVGVEFRSFLTATQKVVYNGNIALDPGGAVAVLRHDLDGRSWRPGCGQRHHQRRRRRHCVGRQLHRRQSLAAELDPQRQQYLHRRLRFRRRHDDDRQRQRVRHRASDRQ